MPAGEPLSEELGESEEEEARAGKSKRRRRRRSSLRKKMGGGSSSSSSSVPNPASSGPCGASPCVTNFCSRSSLVRQGILAQLPGKTCGQVSEAALAGITRLTVPFPTIGSSEDDKARRSYGTSSSPITGNDFKNLSGLTFLGLNRHTLGTIPDGWFSDLASLEEMDLDESFTTPARFKKMMLSLPSPPQSLRKITVGTDGSLIGCTRDNAGNLTQDVLTHLGATSVNCPTNCPPIYANCSCTLDDPSPSIVIRVACPP